MHLARLCSVPKKVRFMGLSLLSENKKLRGFAPQFSIYSLITLYEGYNP